MASTKNILLTFDYELFQGKRSGSVKKCMLEPTRKILGSLKQHKATAIFFIDMMYMCRLKEAAGKYTDAKTDFELIEQQLIEMALDGHYVFNHLHPHWLDALYDDTKNDWTLLDDSKYSFQSLTEQERENAFDTTINLLNEILNKASKKIVPNGYRAGGLYIEPFSIFKRHFEKHGIQNDFSVLINAIGELQNKASRFDFSEIEKNIYSFSDNVTTPDVSGSFTEYAMHFAEIPFAYRMANSIFYRLFSRKRNHQRYGDGFSTSNKISAANKKRFTSTETFSVEMLNDIKLPLYVKEARRNNYLHLLSHPKLVSDYNLKVFDKLLNKLTQLENVEFDFKKFDCS